MKLQVCEFLRQSEIDFNKRSPRKGENRERGFAKLNMWGICDVEWIIDENGDKVPGDDLHDYWLLNEIPGHFATNEV